MSNDLFYPEKYLLKLKQEMKPFLDLDEKILLNKNKEFNEFKKGLENKYKTGFFDLELVNNRFFLDYDNKEIFESKFLKLKKKQGQL
jgi:hypothetical protein